MERKNTAGKGRKTDSTALAAGVPVNAETGAPATTANVVSVMATNTNISGVATAAAKTFTAKKKKPLFTLKELGLILVFSLMAAISYYCFVTPNNFAPGGIYGLGSMIQNKTAGHFGLENGIPWAIPVLIISIPLIIVSIKILDKKAALVIALCALTINAFDILLELIKFPQYTANGDPVLSIFAAIIGGIIGGIAFAMFIKNFGISDGTIAIAAIIKKKRPALNIAWATFAFDALVVFASFFVYWTDNTKDMGGQPIGEKIVRASVPVVYSVVNMFFLSKFFDLLLKGFSAAYKFEVICDSPEVIAQRLMSQLGRGVTVVQAEGMYTHTPKSLLICVVPKKQIGVFKKILKDYPDAFGYIMPSNEVMGDFTV